MCLADYISVRSAVLWGWDELDSCHRFVLVVLILGNIWLAD